MFACYDLCAVLTPCGPLKCLVGIAHVRVGLIDRVFIVVCGKQINLIQEKQAPLPGLLYEADVRDGVSDEQRRRERAQQQEERARRKAANASAAPQRENTIDTQASHDTASSKASNPSRPLNVEQSVSFRWTLTRILGLFNYTFLLLLVRTSPLTRATLWRSSCSC